MIAKSLFLASTKVCLYRLYLPACLPATLPNVWFWYLDLFNKNNAKAKSKEREKKIIEKIVQRSRKLLIPINIVIGLCVLQLSTTSIARERFCIGFFLLFLSIMKKLQHSTVVVN